MEALEGERGSEGVREWAGVGTDVEGIGVPVAFPVIAQRMVAQPNGAAGNDGESLSCSKPVASLQTGASLSSLDSHNLTHGRLQCVKLVASSATATLLIGTPEPREYCCPCRHAWRPLRLVGCSTDRAFLIVDRLPLITGLLIDYDGESKCR